MAKWGIFGLEGSHLHRALEAGLWARGRHSSIPQHAGSWTPAQAGIGIDAAIVHGSRGRPGLIAAWHRDNGVPCIMVDLPHLRGDHGQTRVTPPEHSWLPELPASDAPAFDLRTLGLEGLRDRYQEKIGDPGRKASKTLRRELAEQASGEDLWGRSRLTALGIELLEHQRHKGQEICLLGQLGGDASHGMSSAAFQSWATDTVGRIKALNESEIVWRPHPLEKSSWAPEGVDRVAVGESLSETLSTCWRVVTYCSGAGLEALILGLSVVAEGPAPYASLAGRLGRWVATPKPDPVALEALLVRVAHTQWTLEEISRGQAFEHLGMEVLGG